MHNACPMKISCETSNRERNLDNNVRFQTTMFVCVCARSHRQLQRLVESISFAMQEGARTAALGNSHPGQSGFLSTHTHTQRKLQLSLPGLFHHKGLSFNLISVKGVIQNTLGSKMDFHMDCCLSRADEKCKSLQKALNQSRSCSDSSRYAHRSKEGKSQCSLICFKKKKTGKLQKRSCAM